MDYVLFALLAGMIACANPNPVKSAGATPTPEVTESAEYKWTKLLDSAPWKKNYNFQMFSKGDTLWTFHPDGNWFSLDGISWDKSPLQNVIFNLAFLDYVVFKNSIYGLGHFEGNIEAFQFKPEIYQTYDLLSWVTLSTKSNLPKRFFYHPFVFQNKIWIIGGEDKNKKYSDVWNSPDGVTWTRIKDQMPFGPRSGSQIVQLHGTLYLLDNDVWSSKDGIEWTKVTDEIVQGQPIFGYAAVVMDDKIFLLGCNRNGQFTSQTYYSSTGKDWMSMDAPWSPRGGIAATLHQGRIYMTGGKYGGTPNHPEFRYDNDVWVLEKK